MAPKGSPRMLYAASLLASTNGQIPVKVALSRAGFSAEEIAKEKKQRQARRRRDFLLKKKKMKKIKGKRAMATLPLSLPRTIANAATDQHQQEEQENEPDQAPTSILNTPNSFEYDMDSHQEVIHDTSRLDALILACSMQQPITSDNLLTTSDDFPLFNFTSNDLTSTSCSGSSDLNENSSTSI